MGRPKKLWSVTAGAHGYTVVACERRTGGALSLRYWNPGEKRVVWRALHHSDRELATQQAKELSAQLLASTVAAQQGKATLPEVVGLYERDVVIHAKHPNELRRHLDIFTAYFGPARDVTTMSFPDIDTYVRERRAGRVAVAGHTLSATPSDRAIAAELTTWRAALNHAVKCVRPDGSRVLPVNPMQGYALPRNRNVRRPVASYDRYEALLAVADDVDPQRLFRCFLPIIEGTGWRVSAVCALRACDVDRSSSPLAPFGRLYRAPEHDKQGLGGWLPINADVRAALDLLFERRPIVGDVPLYPAPKSQPGKPTAWSRHHAAKLLRRAQRMAGLAPLDGSEYHAYRRGWAVARKHLPPTDVARAGMWSDLATLQRCYQQADDATTLDVILTTRKAGREVAG